MMLPNELVWIMEKLGFEWPDIDEDEVQTDFDEGLADEDDLDDQDDEALNP